MAGDYFDIKFSYTGKDGQQRTELIKIQKGVVIDFNNKDGYYENSYTINEKGQAVATYDPKKHNEVVKEIEATEEQINNLLRIQRNNEDGGLSKKDYEIEKQKDFNARRTASWDDATIHTFKKNHPILGAVLPDSWILKVAK